MNHSANELNGSSMERLLFSTLFQRSNKNSFINHLNFDIDNERLMWCIRISHQFVQKYGANDEIFERANVTVVKNGFFSLLVPHDTKSRLLYYCYCVILILQWRILVRILAIHPNFLYIHSNPHFHIYFCTHRLA